MSESNSIGRTPAAAQSTQRSLEQLWAQAVAHDQAGRLLDAGKLYRTLLERDPGHPEANHNLGMIAVRAGDPAASLPYFTAALDTDATCAKYWLHYIDALFQAGQEEEARDVLALARRHGLEGNEVNALAARIGALESADGNGLPSLPADEVPPSSAVGGLVPPGQEMDSLLDLFRQGRHAEAAALARNLTERFPRHGLGWKVLGVVLKLQGRDHEALGPMRRAATLSAGDAEAQYNLGVTLYELNHCEEAAAAYRRALEADPGYAEAALNLGVTLNRLGCLKEAEESLGQALRIKPFYAAAHGNLAVVLRQLGRLEEAETNCRQAIAINPDDATTINALADILQASDRSAEAEAACRRAIEIRPDYAEAHANLGLILKAQDRLNEAEASLRKTLTINPKDARAHNNLGVVLQQLGRLDEADGRFLAALAIDAEDAATHANRGNLLRHMGRLDEAISCYMQGIGLDPQNASATHVALGQVLLLAQRFQEAETHFVRALQIAPDQLDALAGLGLALQGMGRLAEAEHCYRRILRGKPDNAGVINNLGVVLQQLGRLDEAETCYRRSLQLQPDHGPIYSNFLFYLTLSARVDAKSTFAEHVRFGARFESCLMAERAPHTVNREPERRLRIGFVSADFHNHAVASFIEPILRHLSARPDLRLHAYYNNFINDEVTGRLRRQFAEWNAIADLPDGQLADKVRADHVDILIDLAGHTAGNRLPAFARKPAPVQASWIGYPGTTGLSTMDYYLADRFLLPPGRFDDQFVEKLVRLPVIAPFQPYEAAPEVNRLPAFENRHLTFGSFNRPNKLSREVIALWARLMNALPDSRMLLGGMAENGQWGALVEWFAAEGIERHRLEFHARSTMDNYMTLHHQVDICLDTFPYNGGTTTNHALWMGVPTLTLAGDRMPGRAGTAVLLHVGLQGFAVECADDFVSRGLYWSQNLPALADLRAGLRGRVSASPLGRPELLAASLGRALRTMWRRWCEGRPPEAFEVAPPGMDATTTNAGQGA